MSGINGKWVLDDNENMRLVPKKNTGEKKCVHGISLSEDCEKCDFESEMYDIDEKEDD